MHTKRLFLADLTDYHLKLLLKVVEYSRNETIEDWMREVESGYLGMYEICDGKGLIGLKRFSTHVFVSFLVGEELKPYTDQFIPWLKEISGGMPIEALVTRKGLVKYYEMLGFEPLGTWMRYP